MKLNTKTIREMASEGERLDGRDLDEYREIQIDKDYIPTTAQGSARVKIGDTQACIRNYCD